MHRLLRQIDHSHPAGTTRLKIIENAMTAVRGYLITMVSGIVGAVIGTMIGLGVAQFAPFYYKTVFRFRENPAQAELNQLGMGLGMLQGLGTGIVVGLVIVCIVAWYQQRMAAISASMSET